MGSPEIMLVYYTTATDCILQDATLLVAMHCSWLQEMDPGWYMRAFCVFAVIISNMSMIPPLRVH